jgi:hypothetical protein
MFYLQFGYKSSESIVVALQLQWCFFALLDVEMGDGNFRLDVGMMRHVVLPPLFPERINLPHFILGIDGAELIGCPHGSDLFLEAVGLDEALGLFETLAVA